MNSFSSEIKEALTDEERRHIYALRYRVYIEDMKKPYVYADHLNKLLFDNFDETATLLYAVRNNQTVGTMRVNFAEDCRSYCEKLSLNLFNKTSIENISLCSRFMVDPKWRNSMIFAKIAVAMYLLGRRRNVELNFMHCAPHLVRIFEYIGYQRYMDEFYDQEVGVQVPMILLLNDIDHLKKVRSPIYKHVFRETN